MTAELPINVARFLTGNLPDDELPGFTLDLLLAAALGPGGKFGKSLVPGPKNLPIDETSRMARELDTSTFKSLKPGSYDAPNRPPRPISEDYPHGVKTGANGRILFDPEGRNLGVMFIVGRIRDGIEDVPLPREAYDRLSRELTGMEPRRVPEAEMNREYAKLNKGREPGGRVAGFVHFDPETGKVTKFLLAKEMNVENRLRTYIHELAHVIEHKAGHISTDNLMDELKSVYNTLRNPNRAPGGAEAAGGTLHTPAHRGYKGDEIRKEYIAEAIRAYLTNPNYLKKVAPNTAAAIRAAVKAHPELSRIIQFNSVGGMGLLTIRGMGSAGDESRDVGSL